MQRSKSEIFHHFVWATKNRLPLVTEELERPLYRCIEQEAQRLHCVVLAIGGMPDHVHLAVEAPTNVHAAKIMQMVKGISSHFAHERLKDEPVFDWQDNYAVFSLSRPHV